MATAKKTTPTNVRSAHLSGIAKQHSEGVSKNEQQALMEGYWGRILENQRVSSLRVAWQDLWIKAGRYLSKEDIKNVGEGFVFAAESHKDQRRYSGDPYVVHTVSVAAILTEMELDSETIVAALLHDVLEDTDATIDDLIQLGLSDEQITAIRLMTKKKGDNYDEYIDRIKGNKIARQVKIKDLEDNMDLTRLLHLEEKDIERLKKYHKSYIKLTRYEN